MLEEGGLFIVSVARVVDVERLRHGAERLFHRRKRTNRALVAVSPQALRELQPLLNLSDIVTTLHSLINVRIVLPRLLRLHFRDIRRSVLALSISHPSCTRNLTRLLMQEAIR